MTLPFLAGLFALVVTSAFHERQRALDDGQRLAVDQARAVAETFARVVESADLLLQQGRLLEGQLNHADPQALRAFSGHLSAGRDQLAHVDWIQLLDAGGEMVLATPPREAAPAPMRAWSGHEIVAGQRHADAGMLVGVAQGEAGAQLLLSRRLSDAEGRLRGVLVLAIRLGYLDRLFQDVRGTDGAALEIVRADLAVLLRLPATGAAAEKPPLFRAMIQASPAGTYEAVDAGGVTRLHAFRQAGAYPLFVDVGIDRDRTLGAWRRRQLTALIPIVGIWLACVGIAWYAYRRGHSEDSNRLVLAAAMRDLETKVRERTESREATVARLREVVQEKEMLFQELNHRVKNNLQLISSLLGLQAAKIKDPEGRRALEISLERVHSISLVHELLYHREDIAVVDVPVYLDALVARIDTAFFGDGRISCKIDADAVQLPPDVCIRLALIVNEVVTNAAKHAFPDGRRGHITLAFRVAEARYRLSVADDGVGIDAEHEGGKPGHFGLQIVDLLARYLNGTCTRDSGSFGTIVTVSFPQAAQEPA